MKLLMLLALAGLASCSTTLIGGDRARDVSLRYKYYDDDGKEIQVEVEAERLGLGLVGGAPRKAAVAAPAPAPAPAPAARLAPVSAVPRPQTRTRFVPVEAAPVRRVETRFIPTEVQLQPQVRTRLVEVAPAPQVTHYVQVEAPRARYVRLDDDDDDDLPVLFRASRPVAPPTPAPLQRLAPLRSSLAAVDTVLAVPARRVSYSSDEE
ncbi:translation initiation factor IF-2-like [Penaeus chinensis]|uniref:translation initiation factor IF-2-like n=1 Tax=Penaeus chinensis TaxID=139456 RepID=UPI001FB7CB76|nr:translation initiation factor IF-2-like [Penaeus chinensis]